jgi:hypothetical protein
MKYCALYAYVKLSRHIQHFKRRRNTYNDQISPVMGCTPYGIANCVMVKYTTNENGEYMYICTKCDKQQYNFYKTSYIVFHFPNYMNSMLCLHLIYVQLLSLIDIGLQIQEKHFGFSIKQMSEKNLLNTPSLNWNSIYIYIYNVYIVITC